MLKRLRKWLARHREARDAVNRRLDAPPPSIAHRRAEKRQRFLGKTPLDQFARGRRW